MAVIMVINQIYTSKYLLLILCKLQILHMSEFVPNLVFRGGGQSIAPIPVGGINEVSTLNLTCLSIGRSICIWSVCRKIV